MVLKEKVVVMIWAKESATQSTAVYYQRPIVHVNVFFPHLFQ
jgi:hypothetical protein